MRKAYLSRIITYNRGKIVDLKDSYLIVENGKIKGITTKKQENFIDYREYVILPGFVDTHTHLSQMDARAKWYPDLIGWLEKYIFPTEMKFKDSEYAKETSRLFFQELVKNGTTTASVYSSPFKDATDIAFQEAAKIGIRAIMGQVLMDINVPDELKIDVDTAKRDIMELANKWNSYKNMLYYAVTPRFAVSCSMNLMKEVTKIAKDLGLYIQTHISEQEGEIEEALRIHKNYKNYADIYLNAGLLGNRTILAHGVHLNDDELKILKKTDTRVSHCPASNFFLHSGIMNIEKLKSYDIKIGFGSDIAAGPYFSMLNIARDASYANKLSPEEAFYYITLGGARILGFENITGSIEPEKSADFVVIDFSNLVDNSASADTKEILSSLIYRGDDRNIVATYVAGKKVYEKGKI